MTPEDFLNPDSDNTNFELDPARLELVQLQLAVENRCYLLAVMKTQTAILEALQNNAVDEDRINELMEIKLGDLSEIVREEMAEKLAFIAVK